MKLDEAVELLGNCRWFKARKSSVRAVSYQRGFGKLADVTVRRLKNESFAEMLIRAAERVKAGRMPIRRVPVQQVGETCRCGRTDRLAWNDQLKARLCGRCTVAWHTAAKTNDIGPIKSDEVM